MAIQLLDKTLVMKPRRSHHVKPVRVEEVVDETIENVYGEPKADRFDEIIDLLKQGNIYGDKEIVANAIVHDINDVFSIYTDGTTKTTDKHPLFVNNKWTNAEILGWKHNSTFIDKLYNLEIKVTTKTFIIDNIIASGMVENETVNIDKI